MVGVTDSFFSYRKKIRRRRDFDFNAFIDAMTEEFAARVVDGLREPARDRAAGQDGRDFKEILTEEVAKFDSVEEVRYLGEYLVDYWKKLHEK